ncbi:MAG: hypothetical protein QM679_05905 [Patulibacter sp.]
MSVRVELIDEAVDDLRKYAKTGRLKDFLTKLVRIEEQGDQAGEPLSGGLHGYRKMVVGDRDWRIVFRVVDGVATVVVIGDRADSECYTEAAQRLERLATESATSLATVLLELIKAQQQRKRR